MGPPLSLAGSSLFVSSVLPAPPLAAILGRGRGPPGGFCADERPDCVHLGAALFLPGGACRYPAAEQCMRTCGQCWRAGAADRCQTPVGSCYPFCATRVDWASFLERALRRPAAGPGGGHLLSRKPPLAEFPHFLADSEADELAALAESLGLQQEDDLPRTVRNVLKLDCEQPKCLFHPLVGEIYRRTSSLLGIPVHNFESIEFLKYKKGGHYQAHPDTGDDDIKDPRQVGSGLRVLTVFLYLSDVRSGGATGFPNVGLEVRPEKGKVVVWANVEANFWKTSSLALHTARKVKKGKKLAANFWIHPLDVRAPEKYASDNC